MAAWLANVFLVLPSSCSADQQCEAAARLAVTVLVLPLVAVGLTLFLWLPSLLKFSVHLKFLGRQRTDRWSRQANRWLRQAHKWLGWITGVLAFISLAASVLLIAIDHSVKPVAFSFFYIDFYLDGLSVYFVFLVNAVAFFASCYVGVALKTRLHRDLYKHELFHKKNASFAFHLFFNLFHFTMVIVPLVDNLVILWVAIELTTLVSTLLVSCYNKAESFEAAWKYIMITTVGIVFALFGTIFLANSITPKSCMSMIGLGASCDSLSQIRWSILARLEVATHLDLGLVTLSFFFILIGYGTKAGLAPMHTWLPDGHAEAPSPVSALLSGVLLKSALYALLRFDTIVNLRQGDQGLFTSSILLFMGLVSLTVAVPFILKKKSRFKRLLAWHSLEHMGIITFGIGVGGSIALFGALLHALNHALTKALMFLTYQNIDEAYPKPLDDFKANDVQQKASVPESNKEEKISGALRRRPYSGMVLLLGGLGLVGSPGFSIFLSEFFILWAALQRVVSPAGSQLPSVVYALAVVLFLVTTTAIFAGLVKHLARLLLGHAPPKVEPEKYHWGLLPLGALLGLVIVFGFWIPNIPTFNISGFRLTLDFGGLLREGACILQKGADGACKP